MRPPLRALGLLPLLVSLLVTLLACHAGSPPAIVPSPAAPTLLAPTLASSSPVGSPSSPPTPAPTASRTPTPTPSPTAKPPVDSRNYGNFTPYPTPNDIDQRTPGGGYRVVFSENLSRHGSRSVESAGDGRRALALWQRADRADAVTTRGKQFAPAVRRLTAAMAKVGYGELSTLGKREQQGLGQREAQRLAGYLTQAAKDRDSVQIINTGVPRTKTSAQRFVAGLQRREPGLRVLKQRTDKDLHFGSNDPAYAKFLTRDQQWRSAYRRATADNNLRAAAVRGLTRLYTPAFVRSLADPVQEARSVWNLYRAQGTMAADVQVDLTPFMDARTAAAFAFDRDAEWFYSRGPGAAGRAASDRAVDPLLRDFFARADRRLAGGSTAAVYRFAHDTEVAPFAARLQLAGSRPLPGGKVYSPSDSDFRVARVAPMAANISWTLWRNGSGQVLLQVRHNEVPTPLGGSCRATIADGSFYTWSEAKRCLT